MMRGTAILCMVMFLSGGSTLAGILDSDLEAILDRTAPDETLSTLVYLRDQVDTSALSAQMDAERASLRRRHEVVVRGLQERASTTQAELVARLDEHLRSGTVAYYETFWLGNIIRVDATPATLRAIAARSDVDVVYPNYPVELVGSVKTGPQDPGDSRVVEPGVVAVRAPEVWALGITGEGVLVANMDTGVDGHHPALASRWAGVADARYAGHPGWAWFEALGHDPTFPSDTYGHGTHTMGTVCGGAPGDEVGVAPGAYWIAANNINQGVSDEFISDTLAAFEWMTDPDGDPSTNWDVPAVCSNSWGLTSSMGYPNCDTTFWSYLDACEAAGTVILFSAGNEGPSPNTLRRPADRATDDYRTCAVAAVDANQSGWPIAGFSSRGPTYCTPGGGPATKPDIAAPGVRVRSALPGGGYGLLDGTSMASPHVNGVVALMRQANPDLSVEQIKEIIYQTAFDLGPDGEDNSYGWGMVDAYEAVQGALNTASLTFSFPAGRPELIDPAGGTTIRVEVTGHAVAPEPGTGMLYYSSGGDYTPIAMTEVTPNVYDAVFPGFDCGATVTYYFSAETAAGDVVYDPFTAPDRTYSALAYSGVEIYFEDAFEIDQGWSVGSPDDDATTGVWNRMDPERTDAQPGDDHTEDGTICWVTDGRAGGSLGAYDVDDGQTTLTSPLLDLTASEDPVISYWRWYSNDKGASPGTDVFVVDISDDGGSTWTNAETVGPTGPGTTGGWVYHELRALDLVGLTDRVRVRFIASDEGSGSIVEAAIDDFAVNALVCDECPGDLDGDGDIGLGDLAILLAHYPTESGAQPEDGDLDGDGDIDLADLALLLAVYDTPCP